MDPGSGKQQQVTSDIIHVIFAVWHQTLTLTVNGKIPVFSSEVTEVPPKVLEELLLSKGTAERSLEIISGLISQNAPLLNSQGLVINVFVCDLWLQRIDDVVSIHTRSLYFFPNRTTNYRLTPITPVSESLHLTF